MTDVIDNEQLRAAIGANVRRLRKQTPGLTQTGLAEKIGVTLVHISRIENGQSSPSAEVLFALADALGVKADDLRQITSVAA